MSLSELTLTPQECHALLQAIVDCDHVLYLRIADCAKTYSDNPDAYLFEQSVMEKFRKDMPMHQIQISQTEIIGNNEGMKIDVYHVDMDFSHAHYYKTATNSFHAVNPFDSSK